MGNLLELLNERDKNASDGRQNSGKLSRQFEAIWSEIKDCLDKNSTMFEVWEIAKNAGRYDGEYSTFRKRVKRRQEKKGGGGSAAPVETPAAGSAAAMASEGDDDGVEEVRRKIRAALEKREVKEETQEAVTPDAADTPKGEAANVPLWKKRGEKGPPIGRGHIGESASERARKNREMAEAERLIREAWDKVPDPTDEKGGE